MQGSAVLLLLSATAFVMVIFAFIRWLHIRQLDHELDRELEGVPPELEHAEERTRRNLGGPTQLAIGVTLGNVLFQLHRIDPTVLDAIDFAKGSAAPGSYSDLVAYLKDVQARGDLAFQGLVHNFKGYAGEQLLADALTSSGHIVQLADLPNQEGWDALVDGQAVQFKVGRSSSLINEHLERFPEIPVITISDHADRFADHPMVTIIDEISADQITELTQDSLDGVLGLDKAPFGVPVGALIGASLRQGVLLWKGYTDIETAARDALTDTLAVGGSGLIGTKVGMSIGAVFGPLGVGVGAVAGSIFGAVMGRRFAEDIKSIELEEALETRLELMRSYPELHAAALESKADALRTRAREITLKGLRYIVWPSLTDRAAWRIKARYKQWRSTCLARAREVRATLQNVLNADDEDKLLDLVRDLLQDEEQPVYSAELQSWHSEMDTVNEVVMKQLRRLGRA